uniref:Uncharacterized protein n=1 Tax=viral metagenome TaxID=1070528 RepID=A0A6C0DL82_9ZZZZ
MNQTPQIPHLEIGNGLNLVYNNKTDLGIGQFEPENNYVPINEDTKKKYFLPTTVTSSRNGVFIIIPQYAGAIMFKNSFEQNETDEIKKNKIFKAIEKIIKFRILPGVFGYAVFLDTPNKTSTQTNKSYFHQDSPATTVLSQNAKELLMHMQLTHTQTGINQRTGGPLFKPRNSDYTLIEYRNVCVSTAVRNRSTQGDYIRFWACPGTVLCIENTTQEHSTPFVMNDNSIIDRTFGDKTITDQETKNSEIRELYRTQIIPVENDLYMNLIKDELQEGVDYDYIQFTEVEWNQIISLTAFNSMPLQDYALNSQYRNQQEAGKKLNKKQKIKNKSKTKSKKTHKNKQKNATKSRKNKHFKPLIK